jgi:hypothetical protein
MAQQYYKGAKSVPEFVENRLFFVTRCRFVDYGKWPVLGGGFFPLELFTLVYKV